MSCVFISCQFKYNYANLDTACSSTLCGKKCLTTYMNSLDSIERGKLCKVKSCKVFTFGNNLKFQKGNTEFQPSW